jgi:hypothetical protein
MIGLFTDVFMSIRPQRHSFHGSGLFGHFR